MKRDLQALWGDLATFQVSAADDALPFHRRLARENNWTAEYAQRVYQEYLRFICLAAAAGEPVTPSGDVDEAWHLHLCYTRSYWDGLCRGVLGRELHHQPTKGGPQEQRKYVRQYERTLELYALHFGAKPPADIWPPASRRFSAAAQPRKVDPREVIVVPRKWLRRGVAAAAGLVVLTGCQGWLLGATRVGIEGMFLILLAVIAVIALLSKLGKGGGGGGCGSSGCGGGASGGGGDSGCGGGSGCGSGCGGGCGGD